MAAQKATDLRRLLADVEANERLVRDRQSELERHLVAVPATSWDEAATKARYVLNLYSAGLSVHNTQQRELVAAVLADFTRLAEEISDA
jgi:metal-dependent amidase/aminoacylase/carboxypeptidase family protein